MRTYRARRIPLWVQWAQVALACCPFLIAAALAALDDPWAQRSPVDEQREPLADQVERAVAQAEAQGNSARAGTSVVD